MKMKLKRVEHIGIVVKNLDEAIRRYETIFGLGLDSIEHLEKHRVKIALFPIGESLIELIEDQDPHGDYSKFISEKGEGIHHICFQVEGIEKALNELKNSGIKLLNEEPLLGHQNSKIAFLDSDETHNVLIELCEKAQPIERR